MSVLHGLQQGNEVLAEIHKEMSIENVEKLLAETQEAREYQQEISDMLANNMTVEDEEAVADQLAALEAEVRGQTLPVVPVLPGVPVNDDLDPITAEPEAEGAEREEARVAVPA
ncbi:hypothetical protein M422DRAFT_55666 [Sphaerobolus stellatus SS14]|uniref:Charged multivesicular body protein 6 n=1 Tax=Sphaerobolus stellatus (strain SS14) TaxID=990650 RepID=A0A0C9TWD0_SPHS4|nr:hypothetical protein M422DRAFT_55666 [Sphaerobolus stellatus SS14]